jgi:hypothetical protein
VLRLDEADIEPIPQLPGFAPLAQYGIILHCGKPRLDRGIHHLSGVAALFPSKAIETRPEVLAGLKLRLLERQGKFARTEIGEVRPNRDGAAFRARNGPGAQSQEFAWGRQSPLKTRLFPRRDRRLSVFTTGMVADGVGLTSDLLHFKQLRLTWLMTNVSMTYEK